MELTQENLKVFDFTDAEAQVLFTLVEKGATQVSSLSRGADVPRTTVYSALLRLKDRGFVKQIYKGHLNKKWRVVKSEKLEALIDKGLVELGQKEEEKEGEVMKGIDAADIGVTVYRGKRQIEKAYENMLKLSKTERVYFIQGNKSVEMGLKKIDKQYLFDFHSKFKKSRVIIEGANGESVLHAFQSLSVDNLKSHLNRMIVSTLLPDKYMDFGVDAVIFRDVVLIVNIKEETVIFIRNNAVVELFKHFYDLLIDNGRKIDLNAHIRNIIEEKEKA